MIQMSDVSKKYGDKFVVSDIDLPISEGKLTAIYWTKWRWEKHAA